MNWFVQGLTLVLSTIGALLPIVNPLSAVGMVVAITANLNEHERTEQIKRACIYMFCILTAFLVAGGLIMNCTPMQTSRKPMILAIAFMPAMPSTFDNLVAARSVM